MKHVKLPGLIAVAAMALMALLGVGTASATVLCKTATNGAECGEAWKFSGTVKGALATGTSAKLSNTGGETLTTCTSGSAAGTVSAGGPTSTVTGESTGLSLGGCNNTTDILKGCSGEIHYISGTSNGTETIKGCETTTLLSGVSCTYGAGENTVAVVPESKSGEAVPVNEVVNKVAGSFLCPTTAVTEATVVRTSPEGTLGVAPS